MGGESGDLVAEALRRDDGDLLQDLLVGVEIQSHLRVVALDDLPGRLFDGFCADATHLRWWLCGGAAAAEMRVCEEGVRGARVWDGRNRFVLIYI